MASLYGYAGAQLRILLAEGRGEEQSLDAVSLRKYGGGVGYAAKLLYDELAPGVDPLDAGNKLIFATGPLTRFDVPGGGTTILCCKSPLTNAWGESRCGGDFGPKMRAAGYDFLVVEGKAQSPVYVVVTEDGAEFFSADHLRGLTVSEKTEAIRAEVGDPDLDVMCIGPGGENLVRYATVMAGGRAAGRCGMGAVMGSKNLLAVAVRGTRDVPAASPEQFREAAREAMRVVREHPNTPGFREHGTTGDLGDCDEAGDWPTKNWQSNSWGKGAELYDSFYTHNLVGPKGCYRGCPVSCGRVVRVDGGDFETPEHDGAEYESISAFTAFVLNEDMDAAVHGTWLCDEYGLDTISTGAVIAFAMECYENGLFEPDDVGDLDMSWGNPSVLPELVERIALREGIGEILGEGVQRAADRVGPRAVPFAIHGKGLEAPAHDPRSGKALAVTYATANRGMCHIHPVEAMAFDSGKMDFGLMKYGLPDPEAYDRWGESGKGEIVKTLQDGLIGPDILGLCKFMMYCGLTLDHCGSMVAGLTGWDVDGAELLEIGERVFTLQRLFNLREGLSPADDTMPARMRELPRFGKYEEEEDCEIKDLEGMLSEYYAARGWSMADGTPGQEKLTALGLEP